MIRINRRKFISLFGIVSFGSLATYNAEGLDIDVNRFEINKDISLQNTHSVAVKIKEMRIYSNNLNYNKDAHLNVSARVEDFDIGQVMSKSIELQEKETTVGPYTIHIDNKQAFSEDEYDPNKRELNIYLTFKLNHPSIKNAVEEEVKYTLPIDAAGELKTHSFSVYDRSNTPEDNSLNNTRIFSGSNLPVLTNEDTFEKLKTLISGGGLSENNTKSTYTIPPGVIDIDGIRFQYSSPRDYQNISNNKEPMSESISGSDLPVLTKDNKFEKLKTLISGGGLSENNTKSTYTIPPGVIDIDGIRFQYSSPRDYQNISDSRPSNSTYHLK